MTNHSRQVNEALLEHLQGVFAVLPRVVHTSLFPANKQETLLIQFETTPYPADIDAVSLEIRAYTNGEFHISYLERYLGELRRCRWDRHEQPHNSRDHFHPLPDARTENAQNCTFPPDVTTVLQKIVLPWIDERLGACWEEY